MSVRSAFSFVGYAVGAFFGVPQLGMFIGTLVGNAVDPQKIYGPELGDGMVQTTRAGMPITLIYARVPTMGTLVDKGPVDIFEVEHQQGKGGGPVTVEQRARQTFAILFAINGMGGPNRELPIEAFEQIRFDGKLVYDARPHPNSDDPDDVSAWEEVQTSSAKFLEKCRFYLGTTTQMPDPALEVIHGVGTTPAYRRRVYAVFDQLDITDFGNRIPQVEAVLVGSSSASTVQYLQPKQFGGSPYPWNLGNLGARDPRKSGVTYEYGFYDGADIVWFDTLEDAIAYAQEPRVDPAYEIHISGTPQIMGWTVASSGEFVPGCHVDRDLAPWELGDDANGYRSVLLCISRYPFETEVGVISIDASGVGPAPPAEAAWARGVVQGPVGSRTTRFRSGVIVPYVPTGSGPWYGQPPYSDGHYPLVIDGESFGEYAWLGDFGIHVRAIPDCGLSTVELLPIPELPDGAWYDTDLRLIRFDSGSSACSVLTGSFHQLQKLVTTGSSDGFMPIETLPLGPVLETGSANDGEAFWEAAYARAQAQGLMADGLVYGFDYPVAVTSVCDCTPLVPAVEPDALLLADIQQSLCSHVGIPADKIDVSELTDLVKGFKVAKQMSAAAASKPLQDAYFYARGEWDSKLRFPKLGGPVQFTITEEDLLAEDGLQELTRGQGFDVPRKIHAISYDPKSFVPVPQTRERFSPDVLSLSEESLPLPIVLDADETMQIADKHMKVREANQEGGFRLRTWSKFLAACATDVFAFTGKRYRIDRISLADGEVTIEEGRSDRQSAYTSLLTGVPPADPTPRPSRLNGPTLFAVMNLPTLRPEDNVAGVYVAGCGVLSGWKGAAILLSVDGGANYRQVAAIDLPTPIGFLTAPVDDGSDSPSPGLSVNVFGGDLNSATEAQLLVRANLCAINDPDSVTELVQFGTATETATGRYDLDDVERGMLETVAVAHYTGDQFVHLRNAVFIPIDPALAGQTLYFKAVTVGTETDANPVVTIVFDPPTFILDGGGA